MSVTLSPYPHHKPGRRIASFAKVALLLLLGVVLLNVWATLSRKAATPAADACPAETAQSFAPASPSAMRAYLAGLTVMNYYPTANAWDNMWTNWQPTSIAANFARIAAMHANAVRVVVNVRAFGYPQLSDTMLSRLSDVVRMAAAHGLRVELSLFDQWSQYGDLPGSIAWAKTVLSPYRGSANIAFVELKNELNPSDAGAVSWAKAMVPCARSLAGGLPVSVSLPGSVSIADVKQFTSAGVPLDFYNFHYYGKPTLAYSRFQQMAAIAAPVPAFIGEAGYSTYESDDAKQQNRSAEWLESYQDQYLRTVEYAARESGLPHVAPWIFSDFAPNAMPPGPFASNLAEYHYGLYRTDGSPKPAAQSVTAAFAGASLDTSFNNGFEAGSGLPDNWLLWQPGYGNFARDTAEHHAGLASARITSSSASSAGLPAFYLSPVEVIKARQVYTAGAWVKGSGVGGSTRVTLAWFDADSKYIGGADSPELPQGNSDWTPLSVSATAPANAAFAEIHLVSANNPGAAWFDDVTFDSGQQASADNVAYTAYPAAPPVALWGRGQCLPY